MNININIEEALAAAGYVARRGEILGLKAALGRENGARVLILEGPSGTGKTFLTECFAKAMGAEYIYQLCHHWLTEEELFVGVDVGRVAAGIQRPEEAYRPGVLLRATEATQRGFAVLCMDELDKAPERAETLLLDFLQRGRVYGPRGEVWKADLSRLVVFITTNGLRPLMEPTLRRGFRLRMEFLPPHVEADVLRKKTGAPANCVRVVVRMANTIRANGATAPSLQEMAQLLEDLRLAESAADVDILVRGWLVKEPQDAKALRDEFGDNPAAVLWGEMRRGGWCRWGE